MWDKENAYIHPERKHEKVHLHNLFKTIDSNINRKLFLQITL